jgi:RNA polymerase sigma factor (sigma-70 family)
MASGQLSLVIRYVHRLATGRAIHLSDSQLLELYTSSLDEDAFAILVHRYSGLVLGVCRRVVSDWQAAEDCCQAVFLILALQARSIKKADSLGPWLHGVALKVAGKARSRTLARKIREHKVAMKNCTGDGLEAIVWHDLRPVLDGAIARLPTKYRIPFILCYLQGRTVSEIAAQLGQPRGTVATWLARGREQIRQRLIRAGISLSVAALTATLADNLASAAMSEPLVAKTIGLTGFVKAGMCPATSFEVSSNVLSKGFIGTMISTKLKMFAVMALGASLGLSVLGYQGLVQAWGQPANAQTKSGQAALNAITSGSSTPLPMQSGESTLGNWKKIPLATLKQRPVELYRVGPGDTLGIVVDGVLGNSKEFLPTNSGVLIGYPIPVRDDGTINMPQLQPLKVSGLTLEEIRQSLKQAYVGKGKVFREESEYSAIVTMYRKRTFHVLVIRQDVDDEATSLRNALAGKPSRGTGQVVQLTMGENDIGTSLAMSGGMPGSSAMDVVVIERTRSRANTSSATGRTRHSGGEDGRPGGAVSKRVIRIPLKAPVGDPWRFTEEDITLEDGDVVFVPARQWMAELVCSLLSVGGY